MYIYIYIYIYIYSYLINCEYFNNLNKNWDMGGKGIMVEIYTSPYLIEKLGDFLYPYPYSVNAGISRTGMSSGNTHGGRFICHLVRSIECSEGPPNLMNTTILRERYYKEEKKNIFQKTLVFVVFVVSFPCN